MSVKKPPVSRSDTNLLITFLLCIIVNLALYFFILWKYALMPFNVINYTYSAHHFLPDPRINHGAFNFFRALGQYDAQWYLKIAMEAYPHHPTVTSMDNKTIMDGLTYAFFPLYPSLLAVTNLLFHNIEVAAFMFSNLLMFVNFFSLYFVLTKVFSKQLVLKGIFLLFAVPFSLFFRSYYTEGIYLFLLIWIGNSLMNKRLGIAALLLGLLTVTKANGWLLNIYFLYILGKKLYKKELSFTKGVLFLGLLVLPFFVWMVYTYMQTGNPLYFFSVRSAWSNYGFGSFQHNISMLLLFPNLPIHAFHLSQIDDLTIIITGVLLFFSKKMLPPYLWWISFCLWLSPLLVTDTMSFSRYQSVSYPLFIYITSVAKTWQYYLLVSISLIFLFIVSIAFVNWNWLG